MRRILPVLALLAAGAGPAAGHGILIPVDRKLPPLAMLNHHVTVTIDNQVAATRVEQTFRNHTDRQLEATYLFPVPKGAAVDRFTMWVNGKEVKGELVPAEQARRIYTSYVERTRDPGLLEYLDSRLFRLKVFPVPAHGDQKLTLSYRGVLPREDNLVEYVYPLKTNGKATSTLEKFSVSVWLKDKNAVTNIYSPTHAIDVTRPNDRQAKIEFERDQAVLDKDFQLFYTVAPQAGQDVGLTALLHRPVRGEAGYFMLLVSPRVEMPKERQLPRDMVFVLDTSGSMSENGKLGQAQRALKYCLGKLGPRDRFGLINFATAVNKYKDGLVPAGKDQIEQAKKWVDELEATGGTAIDGALKEALEMRTGDVSRTFTIVFFTDGQPTIGELRPENILKNVAARNTANTRIFTFGVGDDVNATLLDTLADQTRAVSTYVRPAEDIEVKVSALYAKISNPVLTNLKLSAGGEVRLSEIYPPELPDLFHGGQLVILGRFKGTGATALTLTGLVGKEKKAFVYEVSFPEKTGEDRSFVEPIWARRKVGYLLDQIRANGEKKELTDEVIALAKKYGIATPYTSYLVVPDAPVPVAGGRPGSGPGGAWGGVAGEAPPALRPLTGNGAAGKVREFAKRAKGGGLARERDRLEENAFRGLKGEGKDKADKALHDAKEAKKAYDRARGALALRRQHEVQAGKLGVDLSVQTSNLRAQARLAGSAVRKAYGRQCLEVGGVWIDAGFDPKMKVVAVRAQSAAYFRILARRPRIKELFQLGNYLVWVTPSGKALVIDANDGKEKLRDREIDALFAAKK
jgi:Ca-activated chloride channel family protein